METLLIIALLVSNVWLIRKVLTKSDTTADGKNDRCTPPEPPPADEEPTEEVVGKSSFDADKSPKKPLPKPPKRSYPL